MSTPTLERYVRVCKMHGAELRPGAGDTVVCPKGGRHGHRVNEWNTVDRMKGVALASASREGSGVQDLNRKVLPTGPLPAGLVAPVKAATLELAKYTDPDGRKLLLTLRREVVKTGDPYRIRWRREDTNGKASAGVAATASVEEDIRRVWSASLADVMAAGWRKLAASVRGGRQLTLTPIPGPGRTPRNLPDPPRGDRP